MQVYGDGKGKSQRNSRSCWCGHTMKSMHLILWKTFQREHGFNYLWYVRVKDASLPGFARSSNHSQNDWKSLEMSVSLLRLIYGATNSVLCSEGKLYTHTASNTISYSLDVSALWQYAIIM